MAVATVDHANENLFSEERRRNILELLAVYGKVLVSDLANQFGISEVTVRKDLTVLELQGLLQRTHGGALPVRHDHNVDPSLRAKEKLHRREKLRIAEAAVKLVQEGQIVMLDSGTTTTAVARLLRSFKNLMVITNAVNIAAELAGSSLQVILTGGTLRPNSFSLIGPLAEATVERLGADILFLGADGYDPNFGITSPNEVEASLNRTMIEVSKRVVVVCDSSKFGRRTLSRIAPTSSIHDTVTDPNISAGALRILRENGVNVILA